MLGYLYTMVSVSAVLGIFTSFSSYASDLENCRSLAGFDAIMKVSAKIIWFGEGHGTIEEPALFKDAVCNASLAQRPVVVALERPPSEQKALDTYLQSDGSAADKAQLLLGELWTSRDQDGRSSAAMIDLIEYLRQLKKSNRIIGVLLVDSWQAGKTRDQVIAENVRVLANDHPDTRVLVYSGDWHAAKLPMGSTDHAASLLAPSDVISILVLGAPGGTSWDIRDPAAGAGVHPSGGFPHPRAIMAMDGSVPDYIRQRGFDFVAHIGVPTTASPPALAEAFTLAAPVRVAFEKIEADQSQMPPPKDDRERLERMFDLDQAGRAPLSNMDFNTLPEEQRSAAQNFVWREIDARDLSNQKSLKAMLPVEGWFGKSLYGSKASTAAFLVVQHSVNDPELMRTALKRMEPLANTGEVDGESYGLLYDRVSLTLEHRPQRYGSQVECKAGKWQPLKLEDPTHVDERRKALGFRTTEDEYLKYFASKPCH